MQSSDSRKSPDSDITIVTNKKKNVKINSKKNAKINNKKNGKTNIQKNRQRKQTANNKAAISQTSSILPIVEVIK